MPGLQYRIPHKAFISFYERTSGIRTSLTVKIPVSANVKYERTSQYEILNDLEKVTDYTNKMKIEVSMQISYKYISYIYRKLKD